MLFYLLTVKTHNHSLFRVLYDVVPGAKAIRVGYRGMVVANLFAVTAIGLTFDRVIRLSLQEPRMSLRLGRLGAVTAVLALAAIEQVNLSQRAILSRNFERQHLAAVANHPRECLSFYAAPQAGRAPFEVQVDAIMIAQAQHLPTINGYSGLIPPGWDFYDTNAADYERHAMRWAVKRGVGAKSLPDQCREWHLDAGNPGATTCLAAAEVAPSRLAHPTNSKSILHRAATVPRSLMIIGPEQNRGGNGPTPHRRPCRSPSVRRVI